MLTGTAVLGTATIPGREQSVPEARAFVDGILGPGHPRSDVARLLVSELVNAVQHTYSRRPGGTVTVAVIELVGSLRVEVIDEGSARNIPVVREDVLPPTAGACSWFSRSPTSGVTSASPPARRCGSASPPSSRGFPGGTPG